MKFKEIIDEELGNAQAYIDSLEKQVNDLNLSINQNPALASTIGKKASAVSAEIQNLKNYLKTSQTQQAQQQAQQKAQPNAQTVKQPAQQTQPAQQQTQPKAQPAAQQKPAQGAQQQPAQK
jgi:peptidoglycan hydrolase CwlO-like protein